MTLRGHYFNTLHLFAVRPEIGKLFALKSARHPVAEVTQRNTVVPNDVVSTVCPQSIKSVIKFKIVCCCAHNVLCPRLMLYIYYINV